MELNYITKKLDNGLVTVSCPAIPPARITMETEEKALEFIKDSIQEYLKIYPEKKNQIKSITI